MNSRTKLKIKLFTSLKCTWSHAMSGKSTTNRTFPVLPVPKTLIACTKATRFASLVPTTRIAPEGRLSLSTRVFEGLCYANRYDNYSDSIFPCVTNDKNCLGGSGSFTCAEGYIGALCASCDLQKVHSSARFTNKQQYECGQCPQFQNNAIMHFCVFF